jgi:hypothetical protein
MKSQKYNNYKWFKIKYIHSSNTSINTSTKHPLGYMFRPNRDIIRPHIWTGLFEYSTFWDPKLSFVREHLLGYMFRPNRDIIRPHIWTGLFDYSTFWDPKLSFVREHLLGYMFRPNRAIIRPHIWTDSFEYSTFCDPKLSFVRQFGNPKCTVVKQTCSYVRPDDGPVGPKHVA